MHRVQWAFLIFYDLVAFFSFQSDHCFEFNFIPHTHTHIPYEYKERVWI